MLILCITNYYILYDSIIYNLLYNYLLLNYIRIRNEQNCLTFQEVIKNEPLEITFSYWDGTGHRRKVTARKGDSIGQASGREGELEGGV